MFGKPIKWPMHLLHIQDKTFERRHFYFSYTKSIQTIALCCCTDATSTALQTCPNQIHISSPLLPKPSPRMPCTLLRFLPDACRTNTLLRPQPSRLSGWLRGCFKSPAGSCASWAATNLELGWTWNSHLLVTSPSWLSQTWVKHGETTQSSRIKPSQTSKCSQPVSSSRLRWCLGDSLKQDVMTENKESTHIHLVSSHSHLFLFHGFSSCSLVVV